MKMKKPTFETTFWILVIYSYRKKVSKEFLKTIQALFFVRKKKNE